MIPVATDTFSSRSSCSVHLLCTPRMLGRARERERCSVFAHVRRLGLVMWPPRRAGTEMRPGSRPSDGSMVNPDWAGHLILSIPPRGAHGGRAENAIYIFFCVTGWVQRTSYFKTYFFSILDTQVPTALHTSEVTPRSARWVAEDPRRRRGVHRDGLEEAHHPSTDGITFFVRVRPESRSEQLRASVTRSRRRNYHASSVCATANRLPYPPT